VQSLKNEAGARYSTLVHLQLQYRVEHLQLNRASVKISAKKMAEGGEKQVAEQAQKLIDRVNGVSEREQEEFLNMLLNWKTLSMDSVYDVEDNEGYKILK
jgi:hypothetical protein